MSLWRVLLSSAVVMALGTWSFLAPPFPTAAELTDSPQRYAGSTIYGVINARTVEKTGDGFIIDQRGSRLHVIWSENDVPLNCLVDLRGRFEPPDRLHAEAVRFMKKRPLKIAVSIVPALLCLPFAFLSVRWDGTFRALALKIGRRGA